MATQHELQWCTVPWPRVPKVHLPSINENLGPHRRFDQLKLVAACLNRALLAARPVFTVTKQKQSGAGVEIPICLSVTQDLSAAKQRAPGSASSVRGTAYDTATACRIR